MNLLKIGTAGAILAASLALASCDDGYGYNRVSVGYGSNWDPYYGGFRADPYWGWYNDFYYPGTGVYVYDRSNRRYRWNVRQRDYWRGRSQVWRGARRDMRPVWRDYGVTRGNRPSRRR